MLLEGLLELVLGEDDDLEQFVFIRFVVEEFPENLQTEFRQFLPLVDDQDDRLAFVHPPFKEVILDALLDLPLAFFLITLRQTEGRRDGGEEFAGGAEGGVQQEGRLHGGPVVLGFRETEDELAAEGGLARSHLAHDDVQAAATADGKFQLLKAGDVPRGRKEKIRLRGVGEGVFVQVENLGIIHRLAALAMPVWLPPCRRVTTTIAAMLRQAPKKLSLFAGGGGPRGRCLCRRDIKRL